MGMLHSPALRTTTRCGARAVLRDVRLEELKLANKTLGNTSVHVGDDDGLCNEICRANLLNGL